MKLYYHSKNCSFLGLAAIMIMVMVNVTFAQRFMEKLDRGLIAVKTSSGYFVSWRLFGTDTQDNTFGFNVYKGSTKLNAAVITNATSYQDNSTSSGVYTVKPVANGVEGAASENALVIDGSYLNIPLSPPSGCSANDCSAGDLDGDGQYEIVLKWEANNAQDNSSSGTTGSVYLEGLKLNGKSLWRINLGPNIRAGAHYTQFMVYDLDGDGIAEIACKTAPGTKDGSGNYLKMGPAASASHTTSYAGSDGYVLSGPEYYTIFSGKTGAELATIDYKPARGTVSSWGDSYGNRVDRFLACVAYLDGKRPSVIPCRGYYTRATLWALDFRDGKLTERWFFDSNVSGNGNAAGQGNHNLSVGDVDDDGKDEIVYGACTINDDGKLLGSSKKDHGDAGHLSDIDPDHPGLEYWSAHEGQQCADLRDPSQTNGGVIFSKPGTADVGRVMTADVTAAYKGMECWGSSGVGFYTCKGVAISGTAPSSYNFAAWWDGDLLRELLDKTSITKYGGATLLSATGCSDNNSTKATPNLSADLFGDWREEVVWRTSNNNALRIYTTTIPTTNRLHTLMHDPQYRLAIAWQNVAYNQPPHVGFYLGDGMTLPQAKPDITYYDVSMGVSHLSKSDVGDVQMQHATKLCGNGIFVLSLVPNSAIKHLSMFDLSGKLVQKIATKKNSVSLKDFGKSTGVYLIRMSKQEEISKKM